MNKKVVSLLLLMAVVGQSAQGFCGWVSTAAQAMGNFATDVKNIVQPEVFTGDEEESIYFTQQIGNKEVPVPCKLAVDAAGNEIKEGDIKDNGLLWSNEDEADNSKAVYRKDENGNVFEYQPYRGNGKHTFSMPGEKDQAGLFLEQMKIVTWQEQKDKKVEEEQHYEWAQKLRRSKLDNPWLGMRLPAFVFWAVLATGVTIAAKKLHEKFIKPRMDEITKDLEEDFEDDGNEDKEEVTNQATPAKEEIAAETV